MADTRFSVVFVFSYAFRQAISGKIFDWTGTRLDFVLPIGVCSITMALYAVASSMARFAFIRSTLGIAEAGNWPGVTKRNAEWFPTKERTLAQGILNSGTAIANIWVLCPTIGPLTERRFNNYK
jgi:ACS family hexuronate transporter-like MFS transporter